MNYIEEIKGELRKHINVGKGLMDVYSLLVLIKGTETTLEDVHDAWSVNINKTWDKEQYGEHRSLIPFDELSPEVQAKDQNYVDAIHKTTLELHKKGLLDAKDN